MSATSPSFEKVGECLYRNPSSLQYYALLKIRGKQIKRSLKTDNLSEARRKLKDFRSDMDRVDPDAGKMTMEVLADRYLATVQHQAPKTIRRKEDILKLIRLRWGQTDVSRVKSSDIRTWLSSFSAKKTRFGAPSYNLYLGTVREVFKQALDDKLLASSPVDGIKQVKRDKPIRRYPTLAEFRAIVENIRNQKFSDTATESADFVEFMGLAGLGLAETSALTWANVNLDRSQMIPFRKKTKVGFCVPIYPQLRPLLEKRLAMAVAANGGQPPAASAKVFGMADPKVALSNACKRLQLDNYSSRDFRGMFCTDAVEKGIDPKVIAQWQGHNDGGVLILKTYSHVRPVHSEAMAKLMTVKVPDNVIPMVPVTATA